MKHTTTVYEIGSLIQIEVTRYPRVKHKKVVLVVGGEEKPIDIDDLRWMIECFSQIRKDLKLDRTKP